MFPSYFIDELKSRIKLSEVIGSKVKLTKKGREYIGLCPFHNEKTPSFTVNEDKGFYHCFGCGAHGSIITFEMEANGLSFLEAVEKLAAKAGLEVPKLDNKTAAEQKIITNIYEVTELASKFFEENLHKETSSSALNYLKKRGLTDNIIKEFHIGFAPNNNELEHYLTGKGVPKELIIAAGLIKEGSNYAYFRNRIIFPIIDRQKRVIAFGGRVLSSDNQPKYLNSPETLIFDKSRTLYGINSASDKIHQTGQIIVCEGYMDVIGLHQYGFKNAVATLGTALTEENIRHLWQYADEPILCFDGDFAGQKALSRAALRALPILSPKKSLKFAIMPANLDPDELVKEKGSKAFEDVLASSLELFDIIWNILTENKSFKSPEQKAGLEQDIKNFVNQINNVSIKNHYRRALKTNFFKHL
jgi:DNA primase